MLVQSRHDSQAALRPMRKLLKKYSFTPKLLVTDKLRSYASAFRRLRLSCPTNKGSDKTIGRRTRIRRCDDASAKCSGSVRRAPHNAFSACTLPSTTSLTSNAISSQAPRCGSPEPRRPTSGTTRSEQCDRLLRVVFFSLETVNLTIPSPRLKRLKIRSTIYRSLVYLSHSLANAVRLLRKSSQSSGISNLIFSRGSPPGGGAAPCLAE